MTEPTPVTDPELKQAISYLAFDWGVTSGPSPAGGNSLTDATKAWSAGILKNRVIRIVSGRGAGQACYIQGNSRDSVVVRVGWSEPVGAGAAYVIYNADFEQMIRDVLLGGGTSVSMAPIEVAVVHNVAVVAAADILAANVAPVNTPCMFRLTVTFSAGGILDVVTIRAGSSQVEHFNGGVAMNINSKYMFTHLVHSGDTINYRYSVNATLLTMRVQEVGLGTQ